MKPAESGAALPAPGVGAGATSTGPGATIDLSPGAVARSLIAQDGAGAAHDTARIEREAILGAEERALAQGIVDLEVSKSDEVSLKLAHGIQDSVFAIMRPWNAVAIKGSRYRYRGVGFDAAIMPDGSVRYREKDGVQLTVTGARRIETPGPESAPGPPGFGIGLGDPRALLERSRGKDPYAAERRDFLARTRALRDFLRARSMGEPSR